MKGFRWSWQRFGLGVVGASAPEIVRLYQIVTERTDGHLPNFSLTYLWVSVLFLVVGGVFAVAWMDNNAVKCVYLGVSLPVIVSAWGKAPAPSPTGAMPPVVLSSPAAPAEPSPIATVTTPRRSLRF